MGIILKQTIKSSVFSYLGIAVGFVTAVLLLPNLQSAAQIGLTRTLMAYATIFVQFSSLGYNSAVIRFYPYFKESPQKQRAFLGFSSLVLLVGTALFLLIMVFGQGHILAQIQENAQHESTNAKTEMAMLQSYFWLMIPLVFFQLFFNFFDNYCRAMYDSVTGVFLKEFSQKFFILLAILGFWLGWYGFEGFLYAWTLAIMLPLMLIMATLWANGHLTWSFDISSILADKPLLKQMASFAFFSILTGLSTNLIAQIDQIMVTNYKLLSAAGIYGTCMLFGEVIQKPASSIVRIANSLIVEAFKENNLEIIADIYRKSCLNLLIFGTLVYVGIVANLDTLLSFMKPEFATGRYVIIIIGVGRLIDMATGVNGSILNSSKFYKYDTAFFVLLIGLVYGFNVWLIPPYGINGAALAATLSYAFFNIFRSAFVYFAFGLQPFTWRNFAVIALGLSVYGLSCLLPKFDYLILGKALPDLLLRSVFITFLYVTLLLLLNISPEINFQAQKFSKRLLRILGR